VPIVLKYRSLNLLEPSRPVNACNGIALPLPTYVSMKNHFAFFMLLYAGTWTDGAKLTGIFLKRFAVDV
jgi:hypothetical protein